MSAYDGAEIKVTLSVNSSIRPDETLELSLAGRASENSHVQYTNALAVFEDVARAVTRAVARVCDVDDK